MFFLFPTLRKSNWISKLPKQSRTSASTKLQRMFCCAAPTQCCEFCVWGKKKKKKKGEKKKKQKKKKKEIRRFELRFVLESVDREWERKLVPSVVMGRRKGKRKVSNGSTPFSNAQSGLRFSNFLLFFDITNSDFNQC